MVRRPLISPHTGEPIDWLNTQPQSGLEALSIYGEETVYIEGLPYGKTPEYLQERLLRLFSSYGGVHTLHVIPHPLDPYQAAGHAFVSFYDRSSALKAVRVPIRLPASLHYHVLYLMHIKTGRCTDDLYIHRKLHANKNILLLARQMHAALIKEGQPMSLSALRRSALVRQFCGDRTIPVRYKPLLVAGQPILNGDRPIPPWDRPFPGWNRSIPSGDRWIPAGDRSIPPLDRPIPPGDRSIITSLTGDRSIPSWDRSIPSGDRPIPFTRSAWREAQSCVNLVFGSWEAFLAAEPFNELFFVINKKDGGAGGASADTSAAEQQQQQQQMLLAPRLVSPDKVDILLKRGSRLLHKKLEAELSVHWRRGKPELPDDTKKQIERWLHREPLPEELQVWSRSKDYYKIHDERHQFKLRLKKERKKAELQRRLQVAAAKRIAEQQQQQQQQQQQ
ncbi:hypothetical protein, conserved [Eimeria maxima]|uniref:RRM domain-containing protein n=1 Tax=Eimeria maxima TaxID=5804 RepID=U6MFM2_EIMMA|nr:hypothetical protein, conserved [Eimeria maxima]CDJ61853.1 hypothetical protein, conserved [Eimeria maxima]